MGLPLLPLLCLWLSAFPLFASGIVAHGSLATRGSGNGSTGSGACGGEALATKAAGGKTGVSMATLSLARFSLGEELAAHGTEHAGADSEATMSSTFSRAVAKIQATLRATAAPLFSPFVGSSKYAKIDCICSSPGSIFKKYFDPVLRGERPRPQAAGCLRAPH